MNEKLMKLNRLRGATLSLIAKGPFKIEICAKLRTIFFKPGTSYNWDTAAYALFFWHSQLIEADCTAL